MAYPVVKLVNIKLWDLKRLRVVAVDVCGSLISGFTHNDLLLDKTFYYKSKSQWYNYNSKVCFVTYSSCQHQCLWMRVKSRERDFGSKQLFLLFYPIGFAITICK